MPKPRVAVSSAERAAGRRNDALHDGMGFLTQHAAITNEFEAARQSVLPSATVPYWDYTYDGELARAGGGWPTASSDSSSGSIGGVAAAGAWGWSAASPPVAASPPTQAM